MKNPSPYNFSTGVPFSQQDKIHEHIKVSLLLGRRTKGDLAGCFYSFLQVSESGFLQKIFHLDWKNGKLKLGELLNLIENNGNQTRQFSISLL